MQLFPSLPRAFCWTRFGSEAGEAIEAILARKELERLANDGCFYWGVGNALGPSIRALLALAEKPEVLFSPIRGRPRQIDVEPPAVTRWRHGRDLDGSLFRLPDRVIVTSRSSRSRSHYALICQSSEPLVTGDHGRLSLQTLRNLVSGNAVGSSQVTAVVRRPAETHAGAYVVALRARLVAPYFVRLCVPAHDQSGAHEVEAADGRIALAI